MNEQEIKDDRRFGNEATIEGIAAKLADERNLRNHRWLCADSRREVLADIVAKESERRGWDDCERDYFAACLNDEAAKCIEPF